MAEDGEAAVCQEKRSRQQRREREPGAEPMFGSALSPSMLHGDAISGETKSVPERRCGAQLSAGEDELGGEAGPLGGEAGPLGGEAGPLAGPCRAVR